MNLKGCSLRNIGPFLQTVVIFLALPCSFTVVFLRKLKIVCGDISCAISGFSADVTYCFDVPCYITT